MRGKNKIRKYSLSYSFNEGLAGGILGTTCPVGMKREEIMYRILSDVLFTEWGKNLKEIEISIRVKEKNEKKN